MDGKKYEFCADKAVVIPVLESVHDEIQKITLLDKESNDVLLTLNVEKNCLGVCKMVLEPFAIELKEKA